MVLPTSELRSIIFGEWGEWYGIEVALELLTKLSRVRFLALPRFIICLDVAEIYQRHNLECEQLKYVDITHLVQVLRFCYNKINIICCGASATFSNHNLMHAMVGAP